MIFLTFNCWVISLQTSLWQFCPMPRVKGLKVVWWKKLRSKILWDFNCWPFLQKSCLEYIGGWVGKYTQLTCPCPNNLPHRGLMEGRREWAVGGTPDWCVHPDQTVFRPTKVFSNDVVVLKGLYVAWAKNFDCTLPVLNLVILCCGGGLRANFWHTRCNNSVV